LFLVHRLRGLARIIYHRITQIIFIIPDTVVPPYGAGELHELHEFFCQ
jgi:hypothetical protein